jgi:type I restriction enzyme S subunit
MISGRRTSNDWYVLRFDQFADSIVDRVDPAEADVERYVGLEHLDSESLRIRRWGTPDDVKGEKLRFRKGDIIFGRRRFYQRKLAVAEFDGICSAHAMVLRAREDVMLQAFLPFFLQSETFFQRAMRISVGSLSPTINWGALARQEFIIPPLGEQRRIADILWAADDVIEHWQGILLDLEVLRSSMREQFICDPQYPRRRLEHCLKDIVAGKSVRGRNEPAMTHEFGVLKVSAVGPQGFDADENKTLLDFGDFLPQFKVREDDLLITRCNTRELVGRVCIVSEDCDNLMLCDKTLRLDICDDIATKGFVVEALKSREARMQIEAAATGTGGAMKNISQTDIRGFKIPLPDLETQHHIESLIEPALESQYLVEQHLVSSRISCSTLREELLVPPLD